MTKESKHVTKFREKHLKPNESVIAWGDGYIGEMMGSGDKTQHNGVLIVTETLVAFYRKGFIGEVLETIPLKSITSIERKSTLGH
ncbi:PH domain-containing protein [Photobacterium leiognathi]|uniref:PH domain-containing protein n=1 Tax=Photobacterium leiognathi TaxID=553611 RepID=UPI002981EB7A|nr:PH domain-containing protein [Photobacterium leiognathi]